MANGYKTGGRKKGTPNKVTGTVREMITKSISKELESLPVLFSQLEPKEKMDALIKLMPYIIPKAEVLAEDSSSQPMKHEDFVQKIRRKIEEINLSKRDTASSIS
ncbi:hypothetical protein [Maribellus sediminis]|uniref:hypothetical protein n=1 Tax=Maribellus sediminis TaxID=2696285 RepID=UPI00197EAA06|nr:hypothetical protein [Maribellus sediminis]